MLRSATIALALATSAHAWLPADKELMAFNTTARVGDLAARSLPNLPQGVTKVRGVNLGGWLILEPWMVCDTWTNSIGCLNDGEYCGNEDNTYPAESECMKGVYGNNPDEGNNKFEAHWSSWITPQDVQNIYDAGLNTIRIPIGYWFFPEIVRSDEVFPDGSRQEQYLDAVVQKAADLGIFVIIDLHGAPGRQQADAFTGQSPKLGPYFFQSDNYAIAEQFLSKMTEKIHNTPSYQQAVGMLEVLNEPVTTRDKDNRYQSTGYDNGLLDDYYPNALKAIRDKEQEMGISEDNSLHVQFMSDKWIPGNPRQSSEVANDARTGFDDHNYVGFNSQLQSKQAIMQNICGDSRTVPGQEFEITGEWSMITNDAVPVDDAFLKDFFTAQQQLYEKPANGDSPDMDGWIWWTWKSETRNPQWDYQLAVSQGIIPSGAAALENNVYQDVCSKYN